MEEYGGNKAAKPVGMALEEIAADKIKVEFAPTSTNPNEAGAEEVK